MKQALIVIDVQDSFRQRPFWDETEYPAFVAQIQRLIDAATSQSVPVLQVFHTSVSDDPANPFAGVRARQDAERAEDLAHRRVPQDRALLALRQGQDGATLHDWLRDHDIGEIIVSGIRTEQCCETTSRHASDAGFKVIFPTDATPDLRHAEPVRPAIHARRDPRPHRAGAAGPLRAGLACRRRAGGLACRPAEMRERTP